MIVEPAVFCYSSVKFFFHGYLSAGEDPLKGC